MTRVREQTILEKIRGLPPERLAEVEDFVDFLAHRQADERGLTHAAEQLATPAFTRVWDNPADADYERPMSSGISSESPFPSRISPPSSAVLPS